MGELLKKSIVRSRNMLQKTLEGLTSEQLKTIPDGFNNNILWQVGHILVAGNTFFLYNGQSNLEAEKTLFAPGTKPADWPKDIPSLDLLLQKLNEQTEEFFNLPIDIFNEKLEKPFIGNETRGELASMGLFHEAMHIGQIQILKKLITKS